VPASQLRLCDDAEIGDGRCGFRSAPPLPGAPPPSPWPIAVYPDHHPIATDPLRQRERVRAWTTAQVQHAVAALRLHPVIAVVFERAQESRGTLEIGRIDVNPMRLSRFPLVRSFGLTLRLRCNILGAAISKLAQKAPHAS
jgi:hypothetical protein